MKIIDNLSKKIINRSSSPPTPPTSTQSLFLSSNYSPLRYPDVGPGGLVAPVALERLRLAVSNTSVVVSAFLVEHELRLGGLVGRMIGRSASGGQLVGFGRAVSVGGLTASIHDVVVEPSLRRMEIGRKIVNKIIRMLSESWNWGRHSVPPL